MLRVILAAIYILSACNIRVYIYMLRVILERGVWAWKRGVWAWMEWVLYWSYEIEPISIWKIYEPWYCVEDICCYWCISYIGEPIEWYMLLVVLEDWSCDHILRERRLLILPILLTTYFLCHCIIFKTWSWNIKIVTHLGRDCRPARLLFFYFSLSLL